MKNFSSFYKVLVVIFTALFAVSCVHDDKYDTPNMAGYECQDLTATMTLAAAKALPQNTTITTDDVIEGYVSSSDESGNIYKTIYIQNAAQNPTDGFVISVDAVSTYAQFPQGSKVYIKLKGLAMGTYGGLKQLGAMTGSTFGRIPENKVSSSIFRSCGAKSVIVPKVLTLTQLGLAANEPLLGALIQIEDAEFDGKLLCTTFAPDGTSIDKQINDPTLSAASRVVRNSGFASFANELLPSGKGKLIGIFSKFNSTYQIYINRLSDVADMTHFPRKDGITANPCSPTTYGALKTIKEAKALYTSTAVNGYNQIADDVYIKGIVTANDETGNLFKYFYIQDATGGIRVNVNKTALYQDNRFRVGNETIIKLKDLYIGKRDGEYQIGVPFSGNIGQIAEVDIYKYFFDTPTPLQNVTATEKTIPQLTMDDVGKWIKIKDVQFVDAELGLQYSPSGNTNRTLTDCAGNNIILRTSSFATFSKQQVPGGKGDIYAILSYFSGTNQYQLWIPEQANAALYGNRCDGSVPAIAIFNENFSGTLASWFAVSKAGAQVWNIQNFGNPAPCVVMNGYPGQNFVNEDWLISKPISLNGYTQASMSFDSDGRYPGDPLLVYATDNYTGDPATTSWTQLPATLDPNLGAFNTWTNSGNLPLTQFLNKNVTLAFKYTSNTTTTTWEIDNVKVVVK